MVALAIGGAAVLGAGTSLAASSKASSTAKSTAASNNALQAQIYDQNSATLAPYVTAGNAATEQQRRLLGLGDSNTGVSINGSPALSADEQQQGAIQAFKNSGTFDAALKTGLDGVTASLGAKGLLDSGAAKKSLLSYGDNFLSGQLNTYEGQLAALSGQGLSAASAQAGVGQGYAGAVSANNNAASTTTSNAALSGASTVNSALGNLVGAYGYNSGLGSSYGGVTQGQANAALPGSVGGYGTSLWGGL